MIGHESQAKEFKALVKNKSLAQGYLFHGPTRVGKRSFAEALARFAEHGEFSENPADSPVLSDELFIYPKEGSISIDAVREIRHFLSAMPQKSPYRTVVLSDAHLLTDEAQNALLKVTEEPNSHGLLILTTHDPDALRPTLQSRFQKVFFGAVPEKKIMEWLVAGGVKAGDAKEAVSQSQGLPGLAHALIRDEAFMEKIAQAKTFLKSPGKRKDLIKELVEDESFDLGAFMEAVLIAGATKDPRAWHAVVEVRRRAMETNPNPKLQLTALAQLLV